MRPRITTNGMAAAAALLCFAPVPPVAAQGAQVVTRMVEIDGLPMRVQTAGWHHREREQPIVVLENGAGAPVEAWQPVLAALAEFAPVVAYDRSGIGQSPWDEQPPAPEHVNRKLRALLAQIDAPPPYVLVGFSWGGALMQYYGGRWPDEVAGLVFIDAPDPRWRREAELAAVAELGGGEPERLAFYRALAPLIAQLPPSNQAELRVIEDLVTRDGAGLASLPQPTVPVARLVAGRHEPMPPGIDLPFDERAFWHAVQRHSLGRFAESLPQGPHATLIVAAHARHYIMGDDPELVIDAIRRVSAAAAAAPGEAASGDGAPAEAAAVDTVHVAPPTGGRDADRASILAALGRVRPGGTVQFAAGTYVVGEIISVATPGITLLGHPGGTTLRGCDPEQFVDPDDYFSCNGLELAGHRQTVRGLTIEYAFWALHLGCCFGQTATRAMPDGSTIEIPAIRRGAGGHVVEHNTFRSAASGVRVNGDWDEPAIVRNNRFIDNWHAVSINGNTVHLLDNEITVPEPERVPFFGFPWDGVKISPSLHTGDDVQEHRSCSGNIVAGNRIDGHIDGIRIELYFPNTSCRRNEVRDNTIVVRRVRNLSPDGFTLTDASDSTFVGVPISILNHPVAAGEAEPGSDTVIEDNRIEGNRILGAEGIGIEVLHAVRNRIVDNTIEGIVVREPFPGNTMGARGASGALLDWHAANGAGIWVSPGSTANEFIGNTFRDVASHAIVLEGDRNRVETAGTTDAVRDVGSGNRVSGVAEWVDPSPHTVRFVTVAPDVRVEVLDWGGTGEPLVLLAGMMATAHTFDDFAPALTGAFRVLAITRRGFGASSQPATGYDIATLVNDIRIVLDTLGIERAAFVGHSFGAQEIMRFATLGPERVSRVVNIDGMLVADTNRFFEVMGGVPAWPPAGVAERASVAAYRDYLTRVVYGVRLPEAEIRARWRVLSDGSVGEEVTPPWIGAAIMQGTDPTPLDELRVPLLAFRHVTTSAAALIPWYGALAPEDRDRADRAFPALQRLWADGWAPFVRMRGARIIDVVDASHTLYISHAGQVIEAMREFLLAPMPDPGGGNR